MSSRKTEAKDLRSLDGVGLRPIFRPLDPNEKPSPRRNVSIFTMRFPFTQPIWRNAGGPWFVLLLFPALLALVSIYMWLGVSQLVAWLSVFGFIVIFTAVAVWIDPKP